MGNFLIRSKSSCALPGYKFKISPQLRYTFDLSNLDSDEVRFFKVVIDNRSNGYFEQDGNIGRVKADWRIDYVRYVELQMKIMQQEACFMFFRLDTVTNEKHDWLLIAFDPEWQYHSQYTNNSIQAFLKIKFGLPIAFTYVATIGNDLLVENFAQWYESKIV